MAGRELLHFHCQRGNGRHIHLVTKTYTDCMLLKADMASAMPTAGGLYFWTHYYSAERWKNPLSFLVGYSNTLGLVGGICSIDCKFTHSIGVLF